MKKTASKGFTKKDMAAVSNNPEWTAEKMKKARPFAEVFPDLAKTIKRGRPATGHTKTQVTLRLDNDLVAAYRSTGVGWQRRINGDLRKARKLA